MVMLSDAKPPWWKRIWDSCDQCFREQHSILWPHLSRTINLLVIVNISLFFLTGAVTRPGYYFPLISLCLLNRWTRLTSPLVTSSAVVRERCLRP